MVLDKKPPYVRIQSGWFEKNRDKIINELEPLVIEGTTVGGNKSKSRKSDVHLFDIWRLDLPDFKKVILFKIKEIFVTENKKYRYDLDYSTVNVQFTRYQKDEFYDWHSDDGELNTHIKTQSVRKLSMTIQLSDPSNYEGGELQLVNYANNLVMMEKYLGRVLVFDAKIPHKVWPVTWGERYALVGWVSGPQLR